MAESWQVRGTGRDESWGCARSRVDFLSERGHRRWLAQGRKVTFINCLLCAQICQTPEVANIIYFLNSPGSTGIVPVFLGEHSETQ